jgi:hypothetical protein
MFGNNERLIHSIIFSDLGIPGRADFPSGTFQDHGFEDKLRKGIRRNVGNFLHGGSICVLG